MSDLLGIIAPLKKFLSKTEEKIYAPLSSDKEILSLSPDRIYTIPDFQREIRWANENVAQLIDDIYSGPKYLGNVILTQHLDDQFSIIDGQQRITILTMILSCIKKYFDEQIDVFSPCKLEIESFSEFSNILLKNFPQDLLEDKTVVQSDKLHQRYKYYYLWQYISKHPVITDQISAENLLENLGKSTINIILNKSTDIGDGIRYFIDVNLKGKQLDTEDIFKSYLFKYDPGKEIRDEWYRFKENTTKADVHRMNYPLLKFLEHYFYCDLYRNEKYRGLEFGEDFLIKKEFKTRGENPKTFREGIHIIELIRNKTYMLNSLRNLNDAIEIMIEIVESRSTTQNFETYFEYKNEKGKKEKLDQVEIKIIHNIMGKVLKDSKTLPKALIMKYILSTLLSQDPQSKESLQKIYGVYVLAVLFTVFENKKSKDVLLSVLKADNKDWYSELISQINSYFSPEKITDTRLLAQYKLAANEEEEDYRFRCKSLATLYNFFRINGNKVSIADGKAKKLYNFIENDDAFTVEHFIVSDTDSKKTIVVLKGQELEYEYEQKFYKKYVNSLFNFIFISNNLNSQLGNYWLPHKMSQIKSKDLECDYSRMYLESIKKLGSNMKKIPQDEAQYKDKMDLYFSRDFKDQYVEFARVILKAVIEKIKTV